MTKLPRSIKSGAWAILSLAILGSVLSGDRARAQKVGRPGIVVGPPGSVLNNGSLQVTVLANGTVSNIATAPLCARLPGTFTGWVSTSFALSGGVPGSVYVPPGSNATGAPQFTCIVNPSGGIPAILCVPGGANVITPGSPQQTSNASNCGGGNFAGGAASSSGNTFGGGIGGANGFFPCAFPQGYFPGSLVQRIFLPGFVDSVSCPSIMVNPQILGGVPTLPTQMGSGFGGLIGTLFSGGLPSTQSSGGGAGLLLGGAGKAFNGMQGGCGSYGY